MTKPKMYAFPCNEFIGMELRDYFAAKVMQAMIEAKEWIDDID